VIFVIFKKIAAINITNIFHPFIFRTTTNSTQTGSSPLEPLAENNENRTNLNEILSRELLVISQKRVSFANTHLVPIPIPFIDDIRQVQQLTTRQISRRRQRRRRRQRQRRQAALETHRSQEHQRRQQILREQIRLWQQYQNSQGQTERSLQNNYQNNQPILEYQQILELPGETNPPIFEYPDLFHESANDTLEHHLLNVYDEMQAVNHWEQEQINELEGFVAIEQLLLLQDEVEQIKQITAIERMDTETKQEHEQHQPNELELWEHT